MFKKIFLLFFFISSCTANLKFYEKTGFADVSKNGKISSSLPVGSILKITNIENKNSKIIKTEEKIKTKPSRVISLPPFIFKELQLNNDMPLVNMQKVRQNNSFIAKKTKTFKEESRVVDKVTLENVKIMSLEKKLISKKKIYLKFGPFYYKIYANNLYKLLNIKIKSKNLILKDYQTNNYVLSIGPIKNIEEYDEIYLKLSKIGLIGFNIIIQ
tara:strand:+ start:807 stop:1448 length:642 start_codon:yes stop_codon:yes gene_type:complete